MILSDAEIKAALDAGGLVIDPPPRERQFSTSAVDLLLGDEFLQFIPAHEIAQGEPRGVERPVIIDIRKIDFQEFAGGYMRSVPTGADASVVMPPQTFLLAQTREEVHLPHEARLAARVEGRSTLARLGLVVHLTAPTIHCGFRGNITLEMFNFGEHPLRLHPRVPICQLIIERMGTAPSKQIPTGFQGQTSPRGTAKRASSSAGSGRSSKAG